MLLLLAALQIDWKTDLDAALAAAKKDGRPVLLHFYKVDATASERMMKDTFGNAEVAAFSAKAARGDRPGQAGRGPGAPRSQPSTRAATSPPLEPYWWYNCNMRYKVLEVLEATRLMLMG